MSNDKSYHMSSRQFREEGHKLIDWIADYQEQVEKYPVLSTVKPGEVREQLPGEAPSDGESFAAILDDVEKIIMPGITHWQSPNFFGFFPSNNSGPSILGELLAAGLGVQGMLWATSPACTELESHVLDWIVDMMNLPPHFKTTGTGGGVIQDTASSAVLSALLTARERKTGFASNATGNTTGLTAYISTQTHSSTEKGVKVAGIGTDRLRRIAVDRAFAMLPEALEQQILKDKERGLAPFFVCATIGTTSSNAVDPIRKIGEICRRHGVWLHVDAAMAGTAAICPEYRHHFDGLEYADSYVFNPHKWMFTNFDCNCFFVADKTELIRTLSIMPEYLKNEATDKGAVIDYRDWHVQLGRRFRALKLWFVIRHYGINGLRHHIGEHLRLAGELAQRISQSDEFELLGHPPFNLLCFRHKKGNDFTRRLMEDVNGSGELFFSHTVLDETFWIRMSIGQTHSTKEHVEKAWDTVINSGRRLT